MRKIVLATCQTSRGDEDTACIVDTLKANGYTVDSYDWNANDIDWAKFDIVLLHTPWDYPGNLHEFQDWLKYIVRHSKLLNDYKLIQWNIHKGYLLELARQNIPIPDTILIKTAKDIETLPAIQKLFSNHKKIVLKPTVSVGEEDNKFIIENKSDLREKAIMPEMRYPLLLQEYIQEIENGEYSAVYLDGIFSHCVIKTPSPGDFRVDPTYGGSSTLVVREDRFSEFETSVINVLPQMPAYARVDYIVRASGHPVLMEVELIEPVLYFRYAPQAALDTFCNIINKRIEKV